MPQTNPQSPQKHPELQKAIVPFTPTPTPDYAWNQSITGSNARGVVVPPTEIANLRTSSLIAAGNLLARGLVYILDQLKSYDESAIYPIVSVLEPYIQADQDLYIPFPPKSSRDVVIKVKKSGKIDPTWWG